MPEQRNLRHRRERLGEAMREEIETILEGELGDPRIGLANVTEVQLAPDGKSAHVLVAAQGGEMEAEQTLAGLAAARGFIRRELAERLRWLLARHERAIEVARTLNPAFRDLGPFRTNDLNSGGR